MKATGIAHGLKSLADKLHPQLPLTTKESSRLLTALTSSFRKHLDEAHPTLPAENTQKSGKHGALQADPNAAMYTSAAAHAQKHMASVLTNPLLMRGAPRLDYGTARIELAKDSVDPLRLLEKYDENGASTIRIAELVLETIRNKYESMAPQIRPKFLDDVKPGQRVFLWILKTDLIKSVLFADNRGLLYQLAFFMIREGREEELWPWMHLDLAQPQSPGQVFPELATRSISKAMNYKYRWRGRLLRAIIHAHAGLSDPDLDSVETVAPECLHAGFDAFFKAVEIKQSAVGGLPMELVNWHKIETHLYWLPLGPAGSYLHNLLTRHTTESAGGLVKLDIAKVDSMRYDRFTDCVKYYHEGSGKVWAELARAKLDMFHPEKPSADRMLSTVQQLLADVDENNRSRFHRSFEKGSPTPERWSNPLLKCISILHNENRNEEAAWVTALLIDCEPRLARMVTHTCNDLSKTAATVRNSTPAQKKSILDLGRVPFPSFA